MISFYIIDMFYDNMYLDMGNGLFMCFIDKINGDVMYNQYFFFVIYYFDDMEMMLMYDYMVELICKSGEVVISGLFSKDIIVKINY